MNSRKPWQKSPQAPERRTGRWLQARNERIKLRDKYTCQSCHRIRLPNELEVDHIVSLSKNGTDKDDNVQTLCITCHEAKTKREAGCVRVGCDEAGYPLGCVA